MMKSPPCKGCTKRNPGCHDKCDPYKEWKADRDRQNSSRVEFIKNDYWLHKRRMI